MATSTSAQSTVVQTVSIVVLGTDAVLAAQPGTAVQLAHACLRAGFANVIPASWGDELIASATLRKLVEVGPGPAIACSCPIVAHRLLSASADLHPVLLPFVPPPVAVCRYVQMLARPMRARITYVGNCPGAVDESIDIRMSPDALISMLAERHIVIEDQPRVFESIIPADRRRFRSQPGGLPSAEALWSAGGARRLIDVGPNDLVATIAQHIIANENVLIDAAVALGCVCSGASASDGRAAVVAIEPPRAGSPVVDEGAPIQLELRVPAASRTPVDVMAISPTSTPSVAHPALPAVRSAADPTNVPLPPVGGWDTPRRQTPPSGVPASDATAAPRPHDNRDRRALPRAYIVRRRPSPRSTPIVSPDVRPAPPPSPPSIEPPPRPVEETATHDSRDTEQSSDDDETEPDEMDVGPGEPTSLALSTSVESPLEETAAPETEPAIEPAREPIIDLLPTPRTLVTESSQLASPEVVTPLRVVENGSSHGVAHSPETSGVAEDRPRILSATSSAARATKTAVRDLRDAFLVTVPSPGNTITRNQPPDGVTGSIGGVTPSFNGPVTVVRVRNVVLVLLGFVTLVVLIAVGVSVLVERRLNPPPAASAPTTP